jgi:hypothetical protein
MIHEYAGTKGLIGHIMQDHGLVSFENRVKEKGMGNGYDGARKAA